MQKSTIKVETAQPPLIPADQRVARNTVPIYSTHLDLLRGLAALVVVVGHSRFTLQDIARPFVAELSTASTGQTAPPVKISPMSPAHEAVIVFFALSGLLVGGSVLKQSWLEGFHWSRYLIKRLTRLYMVLLPAIVFGALLDISSRRILTHGYNPGGEFKDLLTASTSLPTLLGNLFFLQFLDRLNIITFGSNFSLWSLSYEFWYYILFPLILGAMLLRGVGLRLIYALLACAVGVLLWKDPLVAFPTWLFGALTNRLPLRIPEKSQRSAVVLGLLQMLGCMLLLWRRPFSSMSLNNCLLGLSCCVFLYTALHRKQGQENKVYQVVAETLSRMSYTVYLFHLPFLILLGSMLAQHYPSGVKHSTGATVALTVCAYIYSYFMYRCFEAHTDVIRAAVERRLPKRRPTVATV